MNRAKLFKNGDSQAVRLPKEFRFSGKEVYIMRRGTAVILTPVGNAVDRMWDALSGFSEGAVVSREQPEHYDDRLPISAP